MLQRKVKLGLACAAGAIAAAMAAPALAAPPPEMVTTGALTYSSSGGGYDIWTVSGSVAGPVGMGDGGFQVDASFSASNDYSDDIIRVGGSLFTGGADRRVGASALYESVSGYDTWSIGGFGECYHGNMTIMGKAGFAGSNDDENGYYLGGALGVYPSPNFALTPSVSWVQTDDGYDTYNATQLAVVAEYLFGKSPYSGFAGYANTHYDGGGDSDGWFVGVRYNGGMGTLQDRHRKNSLNPYLPGPGTGFSF